MIKVGQLIELGVELSEQCQNELHIDQVVHLSKTAAALFRFT